MPESGYHASDAMRGNEGNSGGTYSGLDPEDFEYLCRALLHDMGFQNIQWRKGGRDRGRDIVAEFARTEPDGRIVLEKWFIECKHHGPGNPVGVQHLQTKMAWAEAERPDYLLIITSSYLTPDAKDWIESLTPLKPFRIRYWEDSHLEDLVERYPTLKRIYCEDRVPGRELRAATTIRRQIEDLQTQISGDPSIVLEEVLGSPPDRLLFTLRGEAITAFNERGDPVFSDAHRVMLIFPTDYPRTLPQVIVLTPIVHPHVYTHGTVCYGFNDPLAPLLIFMKGLQRMLTSYEEERAGPPFPANRDPRLLAFLRAKYQSENTGT